MLYTKALSLPHIYEISWYNFFFYKKAILIENTDFEKIIIIIIIIIQIQQILSLKNLFTSSFTHYKYNIIE